MSKPGSEEGGDRGSGVLNTWQQNITREEMAQIIATGDVPLSLRMDAQGRDSSGVRLALKAQQSGRYDGPLAMGGNEPTTAGDIPGKVSAVGSKKPRR